MTSNPYLAACRAALVVALAAALTACSAGHAEQAATPSVPEVRVVEARPDDAPNTLHLPARVLAGESARLYARASGFVNERRVDLGDSVAAGQVLAVIATPEIDQAVHEAAAELERAQAALELARLNYERAATLVESGAIARELYNERSASLQLARAALAAARARQHSAQERQAFQQVRAPFDGVVSARSVERGDRVVADASAAAPMFEINALDPLRVLVDVPQSAALQVHAGLGAELSFPELPGERFEAQVVRSALSISEDSGGMRVELELPNPGRRIPAGMVGQVALTVPRTAPVLRIPLSAVTGAAGRSSVVRVGEDSRAEFRPVLLGRNLGNEVEVLSGLAAGDRVVVAPNALLQAGAEVRVLAAAGAP